MRQGRLPILALFDVRVAAIVESLNLCGTTRISYPSSIINRSPAELVGHVVVPAGRNPAEEVSPAPELCRVAATV
jgi:hypothetical protein